MLFTTQQWKKSKQIKWEKTHDEFTELQLISYVNTRWKWFFWNQSLANDRFGWVQAKGIKSTLTLIGKRDRACGMHKQMADGKILQVHKIWREATEWERKNALHSNPKNRWIFIIYEHSYFEWEHIKRLVKSTTDAKIRWVLVSQFHITSNDYC